MRYRGRATSYLEVLTNETNYFDAELGLAQAQLNELLGLVGIYRNLGGGWNKARDWEPKAYGSGSMRIAVQLAAECVGLTCARMIRSRDANWAVNLMGPRNQLLEEAQAMKVKTRKVQEDGYFRT